MWQVSPAIIKRTKENRYRFLGKVGRVKSFTSIAVSPSGLKNRAPYLVGIVDFGKEKATLPLADVEQDEVKIGMKVVGVMRRMLEPGKDEIIVYGVKCVPTGK